MVSTRRELPRMPDGEPDLDVWLDQASGFSSASRRRAGRLLDLITTDAARRLGLELVELLIGLKMDGVTAMAGMTMFAAERGEVDLEALPRDVGVLVAAVLKLSSADVLAHNDSAVLSSESKSQTDNVRHMLIALIDDPRVAVLKLAERVVVLRNAKHAEESNRRTIATEAMEFFAPLAGRLGIWHLKWTLEDLAFRYLFPNDYREIASKLDGRREARERQIEAIRQDLEFRLAAKGIDAEVHGRAKHIYSIWRKMSHKSIDFSEVYDVQAVRVLVDRIDACYGVLGVVHTSWPHIPMEFDDYIANPKENGYRSIHTAVIGPAGKTLEVQIRTREMHDESELGVCSHWAYKDGKEGALQSRKMDWLRSVLEWHDDLGLRINGEQLNHDRVFVTTPQGHVLDLSPNATPLDFAYRVHTEIGHRCRGAKVDGRRVPLNRRLSNGECVEIETGDTEEPRRDWLNPALGYVNTSRARSKIQAWFRSQVTASNVNAGRALLGESAARLGFTDDFEDLAKRAGYESEDALMLAVGVGDQLVIDLVKLVSNSPRERALPGEPDANTGTFQGIVVKGKDRDGLLRDVAAAIAELSISVVATNARAEIPGQSATLSLELHVDDLAQLAGAIDNIRRVPDVHDVRRIPTL
ncbi:MAG: bifunctional (p)ppGpp synthetase/guanosine-3',5'-bis(diphosphate) 3'-pyrophosphohydrolase [Gammaproteobacteria bacterium]|nr:bifunctional (p)ppGpp synthetase/guanosine-3',5'-bis(diphosphate) 3'-pyrophosphohydrolase [Gammaproteobacteria bacterium]MYF29766.1 bifunctional (p)ppGpp synthetase/guanosine-3',5'-bis(diphosphate) 3'-pyrophosphohydrolase [Gammaproteobacteria bacterium]MYK45957.1 bifunctional (p)ppGpp synthetase/guanosine-3',5'-bis(diphosphate) 3'-pyrophosphohydrolase [Gammaproteobacteria bacterium]